MYFKAVSEAHPEGKKIGSTIYFSNCHSQGDQEHEEFALMVIISLEGLNRRTLYIFRHENLKIYYVENLIFGYGVKNGVIIQAMSVNEVMVLSL